EALGESEVAVDDEVAILAVGLTRDLQRGSDRRRRRREFEGTAFRREDKRRPHHAAGEGRQQVADESSVRLCDVAHSATPKENGTTRFSGTSERTTSTFSSIRTVSRGGTCSGVTTTLSTFSMRGSRASA